jgi:hypothetical protein
MNTDPFRRHSPKEKASLVVEDMIARYRSSEQKRVALRRALISRGDDPRLKQLQLQLTRPQLVRQAASRGVYISYIRPDELFAVELADMLRQARIDVWLDMFDVQREGDWHREVTAALERCGLMIAVMSPDALYSEAMRFEREYFHQAGKLIIPVIYRRCDVSELDFWLSPVEFTRDYDLSLQHLQRALGVAAVG